MGDAEGWGDCGWACPKDGRLNVLEAPGVPVERNPGGGPPAAARAKVAAARGTGDATDDAAGLPGPPRGPYRSWLMASELLMAPPAPNADICCGCRC
jgi:hypothetical protein